MDNIGINHGQNKIISVTSHTIKDNVTHYSVVVLSVKSTLHYSTLGLI